MFKQIKSSFLLLFIFMLIVHSFSQEVYALDQLDRLMLSNDFKSVLSKNKNSKAFQSNKEMRKIATGKYTNKDLLLYFSSLNLQAKFEFELADKFIEENIIKPSPNLALEADYVKIRFNQITNLRNAIDLAKSIEVNNSLKAYLDQHKTDKNYKRLCLYADINPIVIDFIQGRIERGYRKLIQNEKVAWQYKDTNLVVLNKFYSLDFLINKKQLETYIQVCQDILALDKQKIYYTSSIELYVDALIFRGEYDASSLVQILNDLHANPKVKYYAYALYLKLLTNEKNNSPISKRVFEKFKVQNLKSLIEFFTTDAENKIDNKDFLLLVKQAGQTSIKMGFQEESLAYFAWALRLSKSIYSEELSNTLAEYQTEGLEKESKLKIEKEKSKNRTYFITIGAVSFGMILLMILLVLVVKKTRTLNLLNKEKELLIKEIHHRVKNNFQTIASLIEMQATEIVDEEFLNRINEGQSRIKSMSLIHQKLYQNEQVQVVDFAEYSHLLVKEVLNLYQFKNVQFSIKMEQEEFDVDTAIPLALILNELLTNSCKYAFSKEQANLLEIKITKEQIGQFKLCYCDGGIGLPESLDMQKIKSIGLKLIRNLSKQLQGRFIFVRGEKIQFVVYFKDTNQRKKID